MGQTKYHSLPHTRTRRLALMRPTNGRLCSHPPPTSHTQIQFPAQRGQSVNAGAMWGCVPTPTSQLSSPHRPGEHTPVDSDALLAPARSVVTIWAGSRSKHRRCQFNPEGLEYNVFSIPSGRRRDLSSTDPTQQHQNHYVKVPRSQGTRPIQLIPEAFGGIWWGEPWRWECDKIRDSVPPKLSTCCYYRTTSSGSPKNKH